jgi:DNA-binding transcriptional regulator YdaS (Cro superfamily)
MEVKAIIQQLGGPSAAARFFRIRPAAVSQWISKNKIPQARLLHLEAVRPDLFEYQDREAA